MNRYIHALIVSIITVTFSIAPVTSAILENFNQYETQVIKQKEEEQAKAYSEYLETLPKHSVIIRTSKANSFVTLEVDGDAKEEIAFSEDMNIAFEKGNVLKFDNQEEALASLETFAEANEGTYEITILEDNAELSTMKYRTIKGSFSKFINMGFVIGYEDVMNGVEFKTFLVDGSDAESETIAEDSPLVQYGFLTKQNILTFNIIILIITIGIGIPISINKEGYYFRFVRHENLPFHHIFQGLYAKYFNIMWVMIARILFIALWSVLYALPFIVLNGMGTLIYVCIFIGLIIYRSVSYSAVEYLCYYYKIIKVDIGTYALTESKEVMAGNRLDFFLKTIGVDALLVGAVFIVQHTLAVNSFKDLLVYLFLLYIINIVYNMAWGIIKGKCINKFCGDRYTCYDIIK